MAFTKVTYAGIDTSGTVTTQNLNVIGVVTATSFNGNLIGNVTGSVTGNVTGNVTGTATTASSLTGTPNITVGAINASSAVISGNVSVAGTITYEDTTNVDSIGVITARSGVVVSSGNVLIGTGTSTGTASQRLQVTGGAYVSGNIGIGTTNPTAKLQVIGSTDLTKLNLSGISSSISSTAVDVFVYDTRKDSDGGAWRKRTQNTSWYNETLNTATRGSRRDFPAVAVIVTTTTTVTIYDGDDPDMPMWMVIPSNTVDWASNPGDATSLFCLNGILSIGTIGAGTVIFEFISDRRMIAYTTPGYQFLDKSISARGIGSYTSAGGYIIVSSSCNDVAMTVLPNAPIDAATGLPVPTIAVATDGGASIINDSGNVSNITFSTFTKIYRIGFVDNTKVYIVNDDPGRGRFIHIYDIPTSTITQATDGYRLGSALEFYQSENDGVSANLSAFNTTLYDANVNDVVNRNYGTSSGLVKVDANTTSPSNGLLNIITSSYNTGWMHGNIQGAWLSDTSTASVTGSNLVTNGDFTTNLNGWTLEGTTTPTLSSGGVLLTTGVADGAITQTLNAASNTYIIGWTVTTNSGGFFGLSINGSLVYDNWTTSGSYTHTGSITTIKFAHRGSSSGILDNVTVTVRGDIDRSVNAKGLQVYGTITKTAVATGSNLVAYGGFSASNYLVQPYNSSLSWGTGNFSYMVWFKTSQSGSNQRLFSHGRGGTEYITAFLDTSGFINFQCSPSNSTIAGTRNYVDGVWHQACFVRNSGTITIYVDAIQISSAGWTGNFGTANSSCYFGVDNTLVQPWGGSLALARISASVPSPTQIAKIYNDEKMLFQENSQCTLYGSSDAVTALAYDDTTKLLSVGTSSGRSDFQGLERINNTTTAVTTAISASNGLIAEQ